MLLADRDILDELDNEDIVIDPFDYAHLQPASYDVHLADSLLVPKYQVTYSEWWADPMAPMRRQGTQLDPGSDEQPLERMRLHPRQGYEADKFWLPPGGVALGCTSELVSLHPESALAADITGCSSLGRWWLFVHATAGFIDPGWSGRLTLELYNASPWWLRLWAGMRIAQIRFYDVRSMPTCSYLDTGRYAGALTALPSAYTG
jgi:dCTP deaminase